MESRAYSRKRGPSPRVGKHFPDRDFERHRGYRESRRDGGDFRRIPEREPIESRQAYSRPEAEVKQPPGFPMGYVWSRGDWLCPSPGCEGFVTASKFRTCIKCGRAQPHFMILTELAKNETFRTSVCEAQSCPMRDCSSAHSDVELRDFVKSREYQKVSESTVPPMIPPSPSQAEVAALIKRWHITEPAVSVLTRLPGPLADLVHRSYFVSSDVATSETTNQLLKCLADIIRPQTFLVSSASAFHDLLIAALKRGPTPTGVACTEAGHLAITLEKEVLLIRTRDFSCEDLGLLAFALAFGGMAVVHSAADKTNLRLAFPKLYVDLFDRVRVVDNPSEIIYTAADPMEAITDRATQARIDALNPSPLLPTPPSSAE